MRAHTAATCILTSEQHPRITYENTSFNTLRSYLFDAFEVESSAFHTITQEIPPEKCIKR
jgi:hypothetical protein